MSFIFQLQKFRTHHQVIRYVYFIPNKFSKFPLFQDSSILLEANKTELLPNKQAYGSAKRKLDNESQIISAKRILRQSVIKEVPFTNHAENHNMEVKANVKQPPYSNLENKLRDSQRRCRIYVDDITKYKEGEKKKHILLNKSSKLLSSCQKRTVVKMKAIGEECDIRTDDDKNKDLDRNERATVEGSDMIVGYKKNLKNKGKLFLIRVLSGIHCAF